MLVTQLLPSFHLAIQPNCSMSYLSTPQLFHFWYLIINASYLAKSFIYNNSLMLSCMELNLSR